MIKGILYITYAQKQQHIKKEIIILNKGIYIIGLNNNNMKYISNILSNKGI